MRMSASPQTSPEQLSKVLEALRRDLDRISGVLSELRGNLGSSAAAAASGADPRKRISQREREVFEFMVAGESVSRIAATLHISEHTVRNHVKAIYRKLGVNSRVQLVCRFGEAVPRAV